MSVAAARAIRMAQPQLGAEVEELVLQVLRSGRLAQGPMVEEFEALCAAMAGSAHAVAVCNGTVALDAALRAHRIGPGDEVITTPFTFAATLGAILRCGATARFADIGDDFTIDVESVRRLLTVRTRAILPVHLYGLMADMPALCEIAGAHGLVLIEDAAQAHGATCDGRRAGSFGSGCFSFYATKNVTCGEGGCVSTGDAGLAERIRLLRNQGMRERYQHEIAGENWRMSEVAAAIAIPQLRHVDDISARRAANAARLTQLLQSAADISLPREPAGRRHVWHQYTVLLASRVDRAVVVREMARAGVETGVHYPALVGDHAAYRDHPRVRADATPVAADAARRCLSLPVHPGLSEADLEHVASSLCQALHTAES